MSNPYCVCAQGIFCEACHEELCAEQLSDSEGYEEIVARWDAKVAEEEAATASLWDNE